MDIAGDIPAKKKGFFEYVFNFDSDTKSNLLNIVQYIALILLPLGSLDYLMKKIFPDADEEKGTVELLGEILGQTILTIVFIVFIHRIITFIPSYSGVAIGNLNMWTLIVSFILAVFAVENQVSKKVTILLTRLENGYSKSTSGKSGQTMRKTGPQKKMPVVRISQPISNMPQASPTHQASRADYMHTHEQIAPPTLTQQVQPSQQPAQEAQAPTSQGMYGGPSNPMVNAQVPGGLLEPMAANEVLGGGSFSAW